MHHLQLTHCDVAWQDHNETGKQTLVLDSVSELDGLERLFCICVGLDEHGLGEQQAVRSRCYRGLTRAQVATLIVNQVHCSLWLTPL